jgi:FkbM family methyltransferase
MNSYKSVDIRGTEVTLHTYNRSLELCARMNYETEVLDFIDSLTGEDVLYDLGAAEGRFSLYAATKGIRVIAFEPENKNHEVFLQNLQLNPSATNQLTIYNLAVGETNTSSVLTIGQPWAGGHQKVVATGPGRVDFNFKVHEEQPIEVVSLDDFIETKNLPFPSALKIDVDGSEIPFLNGAKKTLADTRQQKLIIELCLIDQSYSVVTDFLIKCGYKEKGRYKIPNESDLYNIMFIK